MRPVQRAGDDSRSRGVFTVMTGDAQTEMEHHGDGCRSVVWVQKHSDPSRMFMSLFEPN